MIGRIRHRGPDDHGWMSARGRSFEYGTATPTDEPARAILLHRRLSILDLSPSGRQPMATADGRFHIVFNGEIYNYLELRSELEKQGVRFHTRTDTEVLLQAYARWGVDALPRLIGMFALAVLDLWENELLLARDCFGIKPLFHAATTDGMAFASEIKSLLEVPEVERRINPRATFRYLDCGLTDESSETMLADVHRLPAAHYALIDLDEPHRVRPVRFWRLEAPARRDISFDEATLELRALFLESMRLHLRSDVTVGTALSGGIDSSSIVMAARHLESDRLDFHSFSFIADDPRLSEEKWVDVVGKASRATIHKVHVSPEELARDLDELIRVQDEPFCSTSVYAQYRVFRRVKETGVKVMLDGQGADEVLAGYKSYLAIRLRSLLEAGRTGEAIAFFLRAMRARDPAGYRLLADALSDRLPGFLRNKTIRWRALAARLLARGSVPTRGWLNHEWFRDRDEGGAPAEDVGFGNDLRGRLMDCVARSSLPMLLRFEDRNSMAHGVESRVPFLTPDIVQFALGLPEEYLLDDRGTGKHVFREAMRGITPDRILDRRDKIGFVTPERNWLNALRPWVEEVVWGETARALPALHHDAVVAETEDALAGRRAFNPRVWRWLNLIRWSEQLQVSY